MMCFKFEKIECCREDLKTIRRCMGSKIKRHCEGVKIKRHCEGVARGNLFLALFLLIMACGNDNTAGVITETESGQQVAGIVYDATGKPAAGVDVFAINSNSIASRALTKYSAISGIDGSFVIDGLSENADSSYNIFAKTENGYAVVQNVLAGENSVSLNLAKTAKVEVAPVAFNMQGGDTLCFVGTIVCQNVTQKEVDENVSIHMEVPSMHLDSVVVISKDSTSGFRISVDAADGESALVIPFENTSFVYTWNKNVPQGKLLESKSIVDLKSSSDSSLFAMFWVKLDGAAQSDTAFSLISASNEKVGLNIRQCSEDKKTLCTRIKSGMNMESVDTTRFGGAKILDGSWHHYAVAIYEKHLTIVVDGVVKRNTDIKISSDFYTSKLDYVSGFKSDDGLQNLAVGAFDKSILGSGTTKWDKMSGWIKSEYDLQKQVFEY